MRRHTSYFLEILPLPLKDKFCVTLIKSIFPALNWVRNERPVPFKGNFVTTVPWGFLFLSSNIESCSWLVIEWMMSAMSASIPCTASIGMCSVVSHALEKADSIKRQGDSWKPKTSVGFLLTGVTQKCVCDLDFGNLCWYWDIFF